MVEGTLKPSIRGLAHKSISIASKAGLNIGELRDAAYAALFLNTKDERIIDVTHLAKTLQLLTAVPDFGTRYGNENANRTALRFLYEYFRRIPSMQFQETAFEALRADFSAELKETHWLCRGVANLRNFRVDDSSIQCIELGDGVSIRDRIPAELESLGFDDSTRDAIMSDQAVPFGSSSHILVIEGRILKEPGNLIWMEPGFFTLALRALLALRLSGTGSIGIGPVWAIRAARFNIGASGLSQTDFSRPAVGSVYVWSEHMRLSCSTAYRELVRLESNGYQRAPGNLEIALGSFMDSYDRWPFRSESQLLDMITALEALFGIDTELSFRLAFRVAGLLAAGEDERAKLFISMKGFYDTRSRIVHGGLLRPKHQNYLARIEELRSHVRRLLRSFMAVGVSPRRGYGRVFFQERLDSALLDATEREKLRRELGVAENGRAPNIDR